MERTSSARVRSVLVRSLLVFFFGAAALDAGGFAIAQDGDEGLSTEQPGTLDSSGVFEVPMPVAEPPKHEPHAPFASEGAIPFEALSDDAQQLTGQQGEWAEVRHGYDVHQAWSQYSKRKAEAARALRAAYEAGTEGLDEVGVE